MLLDEDIKYNGSTNELIIFTTGSPKEVHEAIQKELYLYGDPFIIIIKKLNKPNGVCPYSVYTSKYFNHKAQVSYMTDEDVQLLIGDRNGSSQSSSNTN